MDVQQETVGEFHHGTLTVGTSPVSLPAIRAFKGVKLKANPSNAGTITIGNGYVLAGGEEVEVPVDIASKLRIVASQASQRLHWIVA